MRACTYILPWIVVGVGAMQIAAQQSPEPPAKEQSPSKKPTKSNQVDPDRKIDDLPDPTKDPMKDPADDITRDPTKDPDAVSKQDSNVEALRGADAPGGAVEAPDYTGPAILSRGLAISRPYIPINEKLTGFVGINAVYDSGQAGAYTPTGQLPAISSAGLDLNWGLSGRHYRRKDIFDLSYTGHYYYYDNNQAYSGQDESLSAGYTRQASAHIAYGFRETAGLYSNTYSVLNSAAINDISTASATIVVAPNTEAFNDRTYYSTTQGSLTYQKTARLSFSFGGSFFLVRRDSIYLADSNGYQANLDAAYRITRRQTIGVYYSHSEFNYRKIFGDTHADSIGGNYAIALTRTMDLSLRGGATRFEAQSLESVVPNPLVQQVLGITTGIEKLYYVGYAPDVTVTLNRNLHRQSFGASFTEGITPGNGLVLTSRREAESVYWQLPLYHKFAAQLSAGRDVLSGVTGVVTQYVGYYARFSVSRQVTRQVSSYMGFDYRNFNFGPNNYRQNEYRVSAGLRFSADQTSFRFW